jgi:hypothetical protein
MNSEYIFPFHNRFLLKPLNCAPEFNMSAKIQEIRKKLEKLEKEASELKRLKSDYNYAKQFRRMLVKQQMD